MNGKPQRHGLSSLLSLVLDLLILAGGLSNVGSALTIHKMPSTNPPQHVVQCKLCSLSFSSRNKLFDHLRRDHELESRGDGNFADSQNRTAASRRARSQLRNLNHEAYYRLQCSEGNLMTLDDLEEALETFRTPLPVSFRLLSDITSAKNESTCYSYNDDARYAYTEYLRELDTRQPFLEASPYFPSTVQTSALPPREWTEAAQKALSNAQDVGAPGIIVCSESG